jgi:CBS domain-containing protein
MIYPNVGALIGKQQPVTLPPTATVLDAARAMAERRVGAVAVIADNALVGLFTERDLLNRVVSLAKDPQSIAVGEVMTPGPRTIRDDQPVVTGLDIMFSNNFRHLPVLNREGTLVAVLSCRDVPTAYQVMRERWQEARRSLASAA